MYKHYSSATWLHWRVLGAFDRRIQEVQSQLPAVGSALLSSAEPTASVILLYKSGLKAAKSETSLLDLPNPVG